MRTILPSLMLLLALVFSGSPASAECFTLLDAPLDAECVVMPFGDQRGVWLRLDVADEVRRERLELAELRIQNDALTEIANRRNQQVELLRAAVTEHQTATDAAVVDAGKSRVERDRLEREMKRWYRHPALWFGGGVMVSITSAVLLKSAF